MATEGKTRAGCFTATELDVLMSAYSDYKYIFQKKSNTMAATKEREAAWEKICERLNACNAGGIKRTWQQVRMKYKNVIQTANRKKAEARKTGGGPPPPALTPVEERALDINHGRPAVEGIEGGTSSSDMVAGPSGAYIEVIDGVVCLMSEPPVAPDLPADDPEETMSVAEDELNETPEDDVPMSPTHMSSLPVKQLYHKYLMKKIKKM